MADNFKRLREKVYPSTERDDQRAEVRSFTRGFHLGAEIEQRLGVEAVANALLEVLGKDAGDGVIDLGAAGRWYNDTRNNRWLKA